MKIGEEWLRVYVAHDRKGAGNNDVRDAGVGRNRVYKNSNNSGRHWNGAKGYNHDNRSYVEVVTVRIGLVMRP